MKRHSANDSLALVERSSEPRHAWLRPLVLRALRVAAIVGTCLTAINQGRAVHRALVCGLRTVDRDLYWKIPLTFCVPFCVSLYSSIVLRLEQRQKTNSD